MVEFSLMRSTVDVEGRIEIEVATDRLASRSLTPDDVRDTLDRVRR